METTEQPSNTRYLRRPQAAAFLTERGWPTKASSLATYAVSGAGPTFRRFGRIVVYTEEDLLTWAQGRTSKPMRSTSELAA